MFKQTLKRMVLTAATVMVLASMVAPAAMAESNQSFGGAKASASGQTNVVPPIIANELCWTVPYTNTRICAWS